MRTILMTEDRLTRGAIPSADRLLVRPLAAWEEAPAHLPRKSPQTEGHPASGWRPRSRARPPRNTINRIPGPPGGRRRQSPRLGWQRFSPAESTFPVRQEQGTLLPRRQPPRGSRAAPGRPSRNSGYLLLLNQLQKKPEGLLPTPAQQEQRHIRIQAASPARSGEGILRPGRNQPGSLCPLVLR